MKFQCKFGWKYLHYWSNSNIW